MQVLRFLKVRGYILYTDGLIDNTSPLVYLVLFPSCTCMTYVLLRYCFKCLFINYLQFPGLIKSIKSIFLHPHVTGRFVFFRRVPYICD